MAENPYLDIMEQSHRVTGLRFCYFATKAKAKDTDDWQLSIVEQGIAGHYPLQSHEFWGTERQMILEADRLNRERLQLTRREAALIVASSMSSKAWGQE